MRIITGIYKGRRIIAPDTWTVRPTTDYARSGLFNIIANNFDFESISVLDLFSGTGAIGLEFASRGCTNITSVDVHANAVGFQEEFTKKINAPIKVVMSDTFRFLKNTTDSYDFIFAGPPYALPNIPELTDAVFSNARLNKNGWFVIEHNKDVSFEDTTHFLQMRNFGSSLFSIFVN